MRGILDKKLSKEKILKRKTFKGIKFQLINIPRSIKILTEDLKNMRKFFFRKKN